jgi:hypothetical protein
VLCGYSFRFIRFGILKQGNLTCKADVCLIMPDAPFFGQGDCEKLSVIKVSSNKVRCRAGSAKKRNLER